MPTALTLTKYGDLVALVWDLKTKKRSVEPFQVHGMELTMPCLRETVMNVHNLGDLLPVEATASGSLFVRTQIEFVGLTKPTFVVVEMTPVHAHSDHSHTTVARDFFNIGYYTHVTERVSSAFCGDMTDQTRWILFGHKFPGPSFDMLSYCNKSYLVGFGALGDIDDVPPSLWQQNALKFRVRGEDDSPWGDEYPHDPYFSSQFVSRSVLAGYVDGIKKKEHKFYDLERGPWPVITRQGIQLLDRRDQERCDSDMSIVRYSSMGECARAKSFFQSQIKHLQLLSFDDAMERIAGAVPVCMLHLIWTCVIDQHYIRCSLSGDASCNAMTISMADVAYPSPYDYHLPESLAAACELGHDLHYLAGFDPNTEFLTSKVLRHNLDLSGNDYSSGNHNYAADCLLLDSLEVHALFEDPSVVHSDQAGNDDWGPLNNLKPTSKASSLSDFSVKAKYTKVKLGVSHLPLHQPGSKEYEAACKRIQLFHDKTHIKDADKIEKMIVTNRGTGLRPGDSRYPYKCDKCYRVVDTVQRKHASVEQGTARAPDNLRPGEKWMVDGGDATVRSKWGSYRYFLLFTCAKTSYIIIYYLKDNSARAYVSALKYVDRLVRLRKGYGVKTLYGDFFSTHLDQNVLGALRADLGIEFEVTPPYMHWLNGYAEVYMRVMKIATRVRLLQMIGKYLDDVKITDSTDMWPFAMEHARQSKSLEPSTTIEKDTGTFATREQMFREDTETPVNFHIHPFGTRCYVIIQKSQRYSAMTDTAEACLYLMGAGYNPFSHTFVDAPQAHVVLRSANRLQITGRVIFPYMKGDPDPPSDNASAAPAPFTDNVGDPQLPAAVQASEQHALNRSPQFRTWPSSPSPLRQLPPVFDRWGRRDTPIRANSSPSTPLPVPEPSPTTDVTRTQQSPSDQSIPMTFRAAPNAQPSAQVAVPDPARAPAPLHGPGRSRYPTPYTSPSTSAAISAPTPALAPTPAPVPPAHEPTVLPNPSDLRRSSRAPVARNVMNLSRLGMGEDPVLRNTEFDGVSLRGGDTHQRSS